MSFINVNLGGVVEKSVVDSGEYTLRVVNATEKTSRGGKPMIQVVHEVDGEPTAENIFHFLSLPAEGDEPDAANFKLLMLKRYLANAGIPFEADGFNVEDLYGAEFDCYIKQTADDDGNVRNELVIPKLRSEDA